MPIKYYIWSSDPHGTGQPWIDLIQQAQTDYPEATTVFGGDYIDSNQHSKETVDFVMDQVKNHHAYALMGNHEYLMYQAIEQNQPDLWYLNGAKHTIKSFFNRGFSKSKARQLLRSDPRYIFLINLPTILQFGHLIFVHAGLTPNELSNPNFIPKSTPTFKDDPNFYDHIWIRNKYIHQDDNISFAHNYTPFTIVSGHTPTMFIEGVYNSPSATKTDVILPTYNDTDHHEDPQILHRPCPVRMVQYKGEQPRFFTDDGCHGSNTHHGNVCVFDSDGHLVKIYNSDPKEDPYYDPEINPVSTKEPVYNEQSHQYEWNQLR